MGEPIRTGVRVCMPRIGMGKVCMPIIGNRSAYKAGGDDVMKDLKKHMLGWYDVKRQGCTNDSLAENPVLEDLSGNNHPLELKNFVFGGLSGMGGYGTDLTKWIGYNTEVTPLDEHSVHVHSSYSWNFRLESKKIENFKVRCSVSGTWRIEQYKTIYKNHVASGDIAEVYCAPYEGTTLIFFIPDSGTIDYTLEILPNFPNSLVFNGVTPEYVINKDNLKFSDASYGEWTSVNVAHVIKGTTNEGIRFLQYIVRGEKGKNLNVNMPSFIIRRTDETKDIFIRYRYRPSNGKTTNSNARNIVIYSSSSVIIPALVETIEPYDEESTPSYMIVFTMNIINGQSVGDIPIDVKIEFLPNYPAPTTRMYGIIPTLTHGAKCMMMDFVPTFCDIAGQDCYYASRGGDDFNYAVFSVGHAGIAYNDRNKNGTYINGVYNTTLKSYMLTEKRQVVSVNCKEPPTNINNGICIASNNKVVTMYLTQMALNSLILFDRELTEEEMKLVMDKLMKYEDTDNIAGDLSRSAREMALDDSDMYEEYDVYVEGNGAEDVREME